MSFPPLQRVRRDSGDFGLIFPEEKANVVSVFVLVLPREKVEGTGRIMSPVLPLCFLVIMKIKPCGNISHPNGNYCAGERGNRIRYPSI